MNKTKNINVICQIIAIVVNMFIFVVSWLVFSKNNIINNGYHITYLGLLIVYLICMIYFTNINNACSIGKRKISENIFSLTLCCVFSDVIFYFLQTVAFRDYFRSIFYVVFALIVQLCFNCVLLKKANDIFFCNYKPRNTLVLYSDNYSYTKLTQIPFFDIKYLITNKIKNPKVSDIKKIKFDNYELIIILDIDENNRNLVIEKCVEKNVEAFVVPSIGDAIMRGSKYIDEITTPMFSVERFSPNIVYLFLKRAFDLFASLIATILLSPFMFITALAIKLYDNGPVLYKQIRLTKDGKEFLIYKFRSMRVDAEKDGVARLVSQDDDRITPIGKYIRMIRFDELPQLFNIIKGDMSIVGPRPERPEIASQYEKTCPAFKLRLQVKAGLTGYAQIFGKYNTESIDKLKMDLYYISKMSFLYDLQLCFMTIKTLFMKESTEAIASGNIIANRGNHNG